MKLLSVLKSATLFSLIMLFSGCGNAKDISADTLAKQLTSKELLILDVRTPQEYSAGHVPGAINMPHTSISSQLDKLQDDKNKIIVIYCKSGRRAAMAEQTLSSAGFKQLLHLDGDMNGWQAGNHPIEK